MELRRILDSSRELEDINSILQDIRDGEGTDFLILEIASDPESEAKAKRSSHDRRDAIRRLKLIKQFVKPDPSMDQNTQEQFYRSLDFVADVLRHDAEILEKVQLK